MRRNVGFALGLVLFTACSKGAEPEIPVASSSGKGAELHVRVDGEGYHPSQARAPKGRPLRLVFTRSGDANCGDEVVIASQNIRRKLPVGKPVAVDVTMPASGKLTFACGMDMYRGAVVAQ